MDSSVDISPTELVSQAHGDHAVYDSNTTTTKGTTQSSLKSVPNEDASSQELNYVQELVSQNQVVVFSKSQCPHCSNSKSLLSGMGVQYALVELDQMQDGGQVQNVLGSITDARTVPRIFIDGQCVGGNSELVSLDRTGQLEELLKKKDDDELKPTFTC